MDHEDDKVNRVYNSKGSGFSVRCITNIGLP
jgi:hypothetical protein